MQLDERLDDFVVLHRELVLEVLALAERLLRVGDELERLADRVYAERQDGYAVALERGNE